MGKGVGDQCANISRAALRKAGHPMADVKSMIGDLDTPKGTCINAYHSAELVELIWVRYIKINLI